jgi:asparagine synthase (glutamine-hydrolysing)
MIPTYLVSRLVKQRCTVALGGDAGDELFGGYMNYSELQAQQRWRRSIPRAVKRLAGAAAGLLPTGFRGRTMLRTFTFPDSDAWVGATLHLDMKARRRLAPVTRTLPGAPPEQFRLLAGHSGRTLLQRMTTADFLTYLPEDILVKVDRASMLASLEIRAPFLDYHIIEFAFSRIPDRLRATAVERKVLLKRLASRLLPGELDLQRKQGFGIPLDAWFKGNWGSYIGDILREAPAELYDRRTIREMLDGQSRGRNSAQKLLNHALLELWRRTHSIDVG